MAKIEAWKMFLFGMITSLGLMILMGAANSDQEVGRYQISPAGNNSDFAFVIDTVTGEYKRVGLSGKFSNK